MPKRSAKPKAAAEVPVDKLDDAAPDGLTYREELFCRLYIECANASEAYRRAGGKAKRPDVASAMMMARPHIAARVADLMARRLAKIEFDADELLSRIVAKVRADMVDLFDDKGALKPAREWPAVWRTGLIAGFKSKELHDGEGEDRKVIGRLVEVKLADRTKILELAGRHIDVGAWKDRVQHDVPDTLKAIAEAWAKDTWVPRPAPPPATATVTAPAPPVVAGILDG